jgi:cell shape-determining protein MreC
LSISFSLGYTFNPKSDLARAKRKNRALKAELAALRAREAELAALRAREAELAALRAREAELAALRARP